MLAMIFRYVLAWLSLWRRGGSGLYWWGGRGRIRFVTTFVVTVEFAPAIVDDDEAVAAGDVIAAAVFEK